MVGKFLRRDAVIHLLKSQERTNAIQKRERLTQHPIRTTKCGCLDSRCGGWHRIATEMTIPTLEDCVLILKIDKAKRKQSKL